MNELDVAAGEADRVLERAPPALDPRQRQPPWAAMRSQQASVGQRCRRRGEVPEQPIRGRLAA